MAPGGTEMTNHPNRSKGRSPGTAAMQSIRAMRGRTEPAKLFLVCDDDANGDNRDLFVRAAKATDCLPIWRRYYGLGHSERPQRLITVPEADGAAGAVRWTAIPILARRDPRLFSLCHECGHHGSDCHCHRKGGGWIAYTPGE